MAKLSLILVGSMTVSKAGRVEGEVNGVDNAKKMTEVTKYYRETAKVLLK